MTTLIKAVGTGKFLSKQSASEQFEDLSKGLEGAPGQIGYGLGIAVAATWVLQNPVFNGYAGIAAYLPSQKISIVIDNTHGPNATGRSIATEIYKALAAYLAPTNAPNTAVVQPSNCNVPTSVYTANQKNVVVHPATTNCANITHPGRMLLLTRRIS